MDIKILLRALPSELERSICKNMNKLFNRRPSSIPFLSGDTFRKFADIVYDKGSKCNPDDIKNKSIVFVQTDYLRNFQEEVLPKISNKFILITSNSDYNITEDYLDILEHPHIIHWFAKNGTFDHPKLTPIPIGLENAYRHNAGYVKDFKKLHKKNKKSRIKKIVMAFTIGTNMHARIPCYKELWHKKNVIEFPGSLSCRQYRKMLQKYMFVASPPGSGLDCYRTFEAVYLGVIPIVEKNFMNDYFVSLGLPIWTVNSWEEVSTLTEDELENRYSVIMQKSTVAPAYFDFWKTKILGYKDN